MDKIQLTGKVQANEYENIVIERRVKGEIEEMTLEQGLNRIRYWQARTSQEQLRRILAAGIDEAGRHSNNRSVSEWALVVRSPDLQ